MVTGEREVSDSKGSLAYFWYLLYPTMNHPLGVLPFSAEYRGSRNDNFKLDAHPCFYAVYIWSSLQVDCKETTLHRHSLKSQLADTYYFRDIGSKLEIFYSKTNKSPGLCLLHCYDENWMNLHWIWWAQWVFCMAVQLKVVHLFSRGFFGGRWGVKFQ